MANVRQIVCAYSANFSRALSKWPRTRDRESTRTTSTRKQWCSQFCFWRWLRSSDSVGVRSPFALIVFDGFFATCCWCFLSGQTTTCFSPDNLGANQFKNCFCAIVLFVSIYENVTFLCPVDSGAVLWNCCFVYFRFESVTNFALALPLIRPRSGLLVNVRR